MNSQAEIAASNDRDNREQARAHTDIGTHYLRYSISNGAVMLLGFISFPILTRFLDNAQFGILRYYDTLMLLGVALMKFGTPHAIVRFYPYDGDPQRMRDFGTNLVLLPLMLSLGMWALCMLGLTLWSWAGSEALSPMIWCAAVMVPLLASTNIVQMVIRASERSDILMATRVIARMLELMLVLGAVILIQHSALAVYGGKLIAAALLVGWLVIWMYRNVHVSRESLDWEFFRNGMLYGFPLMANELAYSVLANLDRVLLKHITGDFAVRALKDKVLLPMTYAVVALIAMLLVAGEDLLIALSGRDKAASGEVFIVVGITMSSFALFAIANYGLQLKKRTMQVLGITLVAALMNVAMNFLLIPRMGYMGAAWATAIAYAALCVAQFVICPKGLARLPDARAAIISLGSAGLLVAVASSTDLLGLQGTWSRLLAAGGLFLLLYAVPVLALDTRLRALVSALVKRFA